MYKYTYLLTYFVCVIGVVGDWMNYFSSDMQAQLFECCIEPLQRRGVTFTDRRR